MTETLSLAGWGKTLATYILTPAAKAAIHSKPVIVALKSLCENLSFAPRGLVHF
jgi:hypothetical protein